MFETGVKKTNVVIIALVALIVGFFIAGFFGNDNVRISPEVPNTGLVPPGGGGGIVNAHECTRDETCHVNAVKGSLGIFSELMQANNAEVEDLDVTGISDLKGGVIVREDAEFEDTVSFGLDVHLTDFPGEGSAYLCVNALGKIHRSEFPCSFNKFSQVDECGNLNHTVSDDIHILLNSDDDPVILKEMDNVYRSQYVVVIGESNAGDLVEVVTISNSSSGTPSDDSVRFKNVESGRVYTANIVSEGVGTVHIEGVTYDLTYYGASSEPSERRYVKLDFPHTTSGALSTFYCDGL